MLTWLFTRWPFAPLVLAIVGTALIVLDGASRWRTQRALQRHQRSADWTHRRAMQDGRIDPP